MIDIDVFNASGRNSAIGWYVRLWAAVLRRAAVDYALYKDHPNIKLKKTGLDAQRWMYAPSNNNDINSFEVVCSILNLPVDLVRDKVENLTEDEARRLRGMEFGDTLG